MNGIIAALVVLMMFVLSVGGREFERADSTYTISDAMYEGYSVGVLDGVIGADNTDSNNDFNDWLCDYYLNWLQDNFYMLDKEIWERSKMPHPLDGVLYGESQGEEIYIKK